MRESLSGLFLIKIMVVFIVLYNSLLAIAVNYTMAFRVKNEIIDLLEQYEGCAGAASHIRSYILSVGYYRSLPNGSNGYTVEAENDPARKGTYYVVTTYLNLGLPRIPFIGNAISSANFKIVGETKLIYGVDEDNSDCLNI